MNRSYTENSKFDSKRGIYDAFYAEIAEPALRGQMRLDRVLGRLLAILRILTGETARRVARVACFTLSLIGTIGAVGAMEIGRISLPAGIALSASLLLVQYLCIRPRKQKKA